MTTATSWCPNCRRVVRLHNVIDSPVGNLGHCEGCRSTIKVDRLEAAVVVFLVILSIVVLTVSMVI